MVKTSLTVPVGIGFRLGGDWRSRTLWVGFFTILLVTGIATICMFVPRSGGPEASAIATFDQWSWFMMVSVPAIFSAMLVALGWEKKKLAELTRASLSSPKPAAGDET